MATYPSPNLWPSPLLFPGQTPIAEVAWAPTLEDVAAKCTVYTLEGLDEEQPDAVDDDGRYLTFTDETRPNDRQVALMIAGAIAEVAGRANRLRAPTDPRYGADPTGLDDWADLARETAAWHVVHVIERDKLARMAEDAAGGYASARDAFLACLRDLTRLANRVQPLLR